MNTKIFSDAMSEIDTKYVDEALGYKKKAQKSIWAKLGAAAACLAAVAVLVTRPLRRRRKAKKEAKEEKK